jgi:acylphosphatase
VATGRADIRIHGRVQGVAYRASAARRGRELGLSGYVRNLADGSVEVVAEGEDTALAALVAWCHEGPPLARVERVDVTHGEARGDSRGFVIR